MARTDSELYKFAKKLGFRRIGMTGTTHWLYEHPENGNKVQIPTSPSPGQLRTKKAELRKLAPQQAAVEKPKKNRKNRRLPRETREAQRQRAAYQKALREAEENNRRAREARALRDAARNGLTPQGEGT